MIKSFINNFIDLIFTENCAICDVHLNESEKNLCLNCLFDISFFDEYLNISSPIVKVKFHGKILIKYTFSFCKYLTNSKIQKLIYRLKYHDKPHIGKFLGKLYGRYMLSLNKTYFDYIIPVPLHKKKLKKRGYNQSEHFAMGLSEILKIPCKSNYLDRIFDTKSQTKADKLARWKNMQYAFILKDSSKMHNKNVLLVDDVVTTGSTLESCANQIIKSNPYSISILTIAYG